jgi:hypothetical protein
VRDQRVGGMDEPSLQGIILQRFDRRVHNRQATCLVERHIHLTRVSDFAGHPSRRRREATRVTEKEALLQTTGNMKRETNVACTMPLAADSTKSRRETMVRKVRAALSVFCISFYINANTSAVDGCPAWRCLGLLGCRPRHRPSKMSQL